MKFARVVFWIAGVWGVIVIAPLFFLRNEVGRQMPPAVTHPEFYYGFAIVTLMWQVSFFIIARDPARYRAFMIPPSIAKLGYSAIVVVFHLNGEVSKTQLLFAASDFILAILFLVAYSRVHAGTVNHRFRQE